MPNVNGYKVLDYLKENNLFNIVPVVIITGVDTKDEINKTFSYPIVDVLSKPFNERDVKNVIERSKLEIKKLGYPNFLNAFIKYLFCVSKV